MAESADVLTGDHQRVLLPDLERRLLHGVAMADIDQVEEAWDELARVIDVDGLIPVTYMNSAASLKAFVGRHGGAVCTSSNARAVLTWALERGDRVLFFPDQHLGRNTGFELGYGADDMRVWDPACPWEACPTVWRRSRRSSSGRATARCTSASAPSTSTPSAPSTPTGS